MEKKTTHIIPLQLSIQQVLDFINEHEILDYIANNLALIDKSVFPNFIYHNINHSCNVAILSLIMASYYNVDNSLKKVLLDAALLHDIGRIDDIYDYNHGYIGSKIVDEILEKDLFYANNNYLNLVKALIFGHNKSPYDYLPFQVYNIEPNQDNILLLKILKDADTLDLTRITELKFNSEELYLESARYLVNFAKYLNTSDLSFQIIETGELNVRTKYSQAN